MNLTDGDSRNFAVFCLNFQGFDFVQIRLSLSRNIVFALANRLQNW